MALSELPHQPVTIMAADFHQLRPIEGGVEGLDWARKGMDIRNLEQVHRTKDPTR